MSGRYFFAYSTSDPTVALAVHRKASGGWRVRLAVGTWRADRSGTELVPMLEELLQEAVTAGLAVAAIAPAFDVMITRVASHG